MHQKKKFTTIFLPRFTDFDLQGILNSARYVELLAEARFEQMNRCYNYPIENYLKKNQHWVVANININYISAISPGRAIEISTEVTEIVGPKAHVAFGFETRNSSGQVKSHALGTAEYVLIDLKTKAPIDISEEERNVFL